MLRTKDSFVSLGVGHVMDTVSTEMYVRGLLQFGASLPVEDFLRHAGLCQWLTRCSDVVVAAEIIAAWH
jgi:hypothetical protein